VSEPFTDRDQTIGIEIAIQIGIDGVPLQPESDQQADLSASVGFRFG
jgi:hypothetical protein